MAGHLPGHLFPDDPPVRSAALADQVAAVRTRCGIASLTHLGTLELAGSDAVRFLHGQCTQDVKGLRPGEGGYAFLLDARGRNLGDFRFTVLEKGVRLTLDRDRVASTAAWLEKFVIAADVRISAPADQHGVLVAGPKARHLVSQATEDTLPAAEHAAANPGGLVVVVDRDTGEEGFQVWGGGFPCASLVARLVADGACPISAAALEVLRIEAGRPRFGIDLDESVLPEESGQGLRAVSYTKGCYSGQEVVAKQKYLGKPRRVLAGVLPAEVLATPAALSEAVGGDAAGAVTSCVFSPTLSRPIGLAMLKAPVPEPGRVLLADGGVRVEVAALPFSEASPA
jgi:folate-binding protein YgfZ